MPLVPHVSPNTTITSAWGNLVADHVVSRFATAAQRTSQLPAPATGQLTTLDTAPGVVEFWNGTIWRPPVGAIVGRGTVAVPDVNRTSNGLVDAPIIGITPFAYPVSMVATAHVQGGFGSALHAYQMDLYLHSIAAGITALGPIQAGSGAYGAVSMVHSWPVAAGVDPSWRVRVNPSTATAGNAFHTGGGASWIAYAA
jgi:hypothetical protein